MMVGLDRGGAAGKVEDFCCFYDRNNKTRGTIIFSKDGNTVEFSHSDYQQLKTTWLRNKDLDLFKPDKPNVELSDWVGDNAIRGFRNSHTVCCTMHAEMRGVNNGIDYNAQDIWGENLSMESKLAILAKFEYFINTVIKGTMDDPGNWKMIFEKKDQQTKPRKMGFSHKNLQKDPFSHSRISRCCRIS